MGNPRDWWTFAVSISLFGCNVFLDDIGDVGQPCSEYGDCISDLVCNFDTCMKNPELGEKCEKKNDSWEEDRNYVVEICAAPNICMDQKCTAVGHEGEPCIPHEHCAYQTEHCFDGSGFKGEGWCYDDLGCFDGTCTSETQPDEFKQPGTDLVWKRCDEGATWNGRECRNTSDRLYVPLDEAEEACSPDYRLPSRDEFILILGGTENCTSGVGEGESGLCLDCIESRTCVSIFGYSTDRYWTDTNRSDPYQWVVDLELGDVLAVQKSWSNYVRCVREGD